MSKDGVNDFTHGNGYIVGNHEAVHSQTKTCVLIVRLAGGAAARCTRGSDEPDSLGNRSFGDGLRPGVLFAGGNTENLAGIAKEILVEITARNVYISLSQHQIRNKKEQNGTSYQNRLL